MRVGRRRGPSAQDLKFIEQRVHIESDEEEVDDAATNKTDSTTTTRLTVSSNHTTNKVGDLPQKQTERNEPGEPRSFFKIAMDYNKRMDTVGDFWVRRYGNRLLGVKTRSLVMGFNNNLLGRSKSNFKNNLLRSLKLI